MTPRSPHDISRDLRDLLVRGIGYLDANFVHAYTAAFHRIPRLYQQLGADFVDSEEVREVSAALVELLDNRATKPASEATREANLARRVRGILQEADQSAEDRDTR